jgi:FkbM family methyltransferase
VNSLSGKDFFAKIDCKITKKRFGSANCSWVIATEFIDKNSIVYSFGVGEEISFDLAIIKTFGLDVNAFDPTPRSIEWIKSQILPENFRLFEYGISNYDGEATFYPPINPKHISHSIIEKEQTKDKTIKVNMKRLETIMHELGHTHIDILKMDIEGAEYSVIEDIKLSNIRPNQILIELHHRFPNIGIGKSKEAIKTLRNIGYQLFSISNNGEEYSFIYKK